jgi:glycine cleavage system H protein
MDGFSYNNIFDTKGIEYLIIIAFLSLIIPFWMIINKQAGVKLQIRNALGVLSDSILRIPKGLFFSKNHTWAFLERSGNAKVGLDDFLLHITGEIKFINMKHKGDFMFKGELMAQIDQDGKTLDITSPISGKIMKANSVIIENPEIINEDPYGDGWVYLIQPTDWIIETNSYYLSENAVAWSKRELIRFKDFMAETMRKYSPETSMLILQDGGELRDKPLSELPGEVWHDFQKSFLN